ncbi:MAG: 16S rRNA (adenine(1518)-N(6)/adenine(1519)-N(6))-dimethyltransferase RsmA [Candidatus Alcyoniella australis]|nr:16S rRNA (adenine(1518)-N(6)/adenine(1519)-N(6))-dimethyltransferase RsmA [Candidatus Alcyoniella australis]
MPEPVALRKSLSQNFLPDPKTLERIVNAAQVGPDDAVLEIGAGSGHLTAALSRAARRVTSIEFDRRLEPALRSRFDPSGNVELIFADALKVGLRELVPEPRIKIVANLPYHLATPILVRLLEHGELWSIAALLLQKEVVQRICAIGGRNVSSISHLVRLHAESTNAGIVKRTVFVPRPKVDSAILRLDFERPWPQQPTDPALFQRVLRAAFSGRRKMLSNALTTLGLPNTDDKQVLATLLQRVGVDPRARAEQLALPDFIAVADELARLQGNL